MFCRNILALGAFATAMMIGASVHANDGFSCNSHPVPEQRTTCQEKIVTLDDSESFTCGNPKNADQANYCGAVYGYEQQWCARIKNPGIRQACLLGTQ